MMFNNVEIYSKSNCVYCDKAKHYFSQNDAIKAGSFSLNLEIPLI